MQERKGLPVQQHALKSEPIHPEGRQIDRRRQTGGELRHDLAGDGAADEALMAMAEGIDDVLGPRRQTALSRDWVLA